MASVPGKDDILIKLLSVDPSNYQDAPVEAIRRVLEKATGRSYPKSEKISLQGVGTNKCPVYSMCTREHSVADLVLESIKMGTTIATNALLERKGEPTAFVITQGMKVDCPCF